MMNAIFDKCYDDWGNLKDNALNIAFNLGKKKGLRKGIKQGKLDGAREFAEWLVNKGILGNRVIYNGEITDYGKVYLAEWQEGTKDDNFKLE